VEKQSAKKGAKPAPDDLIVLGCTEEQRATSGRR
jgi:hypothetical protein